ncbi:alpha/beta hydrolase [Rathayibacter sp. VKM Ac-2857]|uniref:alpha/beta hydrolase n=1 Tax=Rathayibacter sp. VKM Ac-2857 TaxID=2739020 RepID=UPI001565A143|nr:alpha/beta hydrolase [Rathayibacter sp. VKM Ac-2857]NQX17332.1 alpha/beta hydrolase [Rathayibacter sp. VKM Ac-2857]
MVEATEKTTAGDDSARSTAAKVLWLIGLTVALALGAVATLIGIVSLIPGLGLLSMAGALLAPTVAPLVAVLGLVTLAIGLIAVRRGLRRSGGVTSILGGIAAVTNIFVVAVIVGAVVSAGGSVNLFTATFGLSAMGSSAPDREEVYGASSTGEDLSVSIYEPAASTGTAATIMFVHGGGWISGEPDTLSSELRTLADNGYLVVSVEYELATAEIATWQSAPAQVACAATWIQANAADLGADLNRLAFWGESAGGNLVINTASAAAEGTAVSSCGGTVPIPTAVVADFPAVDVTSVYENTFDTAGISTRNFATSYTGGSPEEFPERYAAVNAATYLNAAIPQTLVMTPMRDDLIAPADQFAWADAARDLGVEVETVPIPLANHAYPQFAKNSLGSQGHLSIAESYLAERLA